MDSSLAGVIVGALIGSIPACLATIVSSMENRAARKHELRKLDIEIYHREKIDALKQYNRALSSILEDGQSSEKMIQYTTAHDTLVMMVSDETYTVMQNVYKHVSKWHNQFLCTISDSVLTISLYNLYEPLILCLRKEMDALHRSSGLDNGSSFEICPPPKVSEPAEQTGDNQTDTPNSN